MAEAGSFWSSVAGQPHAPRIAPDSRAHLVDTTMFYAPRSGGVKRYLLAKRAWLARARPELRHSVVVPGAWSANEGPDLHTVGSVKIPFGSGYRWPTSVRKWTDVLLELRPDLIEAGDPFTPGRAALDAGGRLGVPVVGFAHGDPSAQAALHFGEWAEAPAKKRLVEVLNRFDRVIAASRHIADRLEDAGVSGIAVHPLGVDTDIFHPRRRDAARVRAELDLPSTARLLVFAGRPAKEKNVEALIEAAALLGPDHHLLLISAGGATEWRDSNVTALPYVGDPRALARVLASCDAFVHANEHEPFGLVVLEAMACGCPWWRRVWEAWRSWWTTRSDSWPTRPMDQAWRRRWTRCSRATCRRCRPPPGPAPWPAIAGAMCSRACLALRRLDRLGGLRRRGPRRRDPLNGLAAE
jgi:alpha-1,6-mannosyltransferase